MEGETLGKGSGSGPTVLEHVCLARGLATDSLSLWATIWAHLPTTELESQISNESRVFGWRVSAI